MTNSMLQVLITVWVGLHPATYTLPHQYPATGDACQRYANFLGSMKIKDEKVRMTIECVLATGSNA